MTRKKQPEPVDVVIVGAGAGGATAAKVLSEAGLKVVGLERGPWLKPEHASGDELKYLNRNYVWPDPKLKPRTYRPNEKLEAEVQFSPTPQVVGGGTTHWGGIVPRMTENDFRLRACTAIFPARAWLTGPSRTMTLSRTTRALNGSSALRDLPARTDGRRAKPGYPTKPSR